MFFKEGNPVSSKTDVLWVDSHALILEYNRAISEAWLGRTIAFKSSIREAMLALVGAAVNNQPPDLIVAELGSDIGIRGWALAETIRNHTDRGIKYLPICLLTTDPVGDEERARAEKLGVTIEEKGSLEENLKTIHSLCEEK